jgi:UDP-N-acetylglucosamine--N-acetylmuramyl-(pentapeptide) pyrophosphoryl-undecaprenol N-acetylglucosamine transferase
MLLVMKEFSSKNPNVLHIHATGAIESETSQRKFKEMGLDKFSNIQLVEYIYDMPQRMAAADLVICRAGAMTLSELAMLKKPCILIPSPNVADNHQYKNAKVLADAGAVTLLEEASLTADILWGELESLLYHTEKRSELEKNIRDFADPNANERILSELMKLMEA